MAYTIQEIQTFIDVKNLDPRQLINLIADYLQANPSGEGGGAPTWGTIIGTLSAQTDLQTALETTPPLQEVLAADTTLTGNHTIQAEGHLFGIEALQFKIDIENPDGSYGSFYMITSDGNAPYIDLTISNSDGSVTSNILLRPEGLFINKNGLGEVEIKSLNVADDFADDTAAGVGGIPVGQLYHTAGAVKVRLA